jgi:hypothetical protein
MNINPHSPFIAEPGLIEVSEPKLFPLMNILFNGLTECGICLQECNEKDNTGK